LPIASHTKLECIKYAGDKILVRTNNIKLSELVCKKIIYATGTFESPRQLNLEIDSTNVMRYLVDPEKYISKDIICIGGGFSSFENAVILSQHNKVKILYRGSTENIDPLNKGKTFQDRYNKFMTSYIHNYANYNLSNIEFIEYKSLETIKENQLYVDNKIMNFDYLFLCIGFNRISPIPKKLLFLKNKIIFEVGEIISENIMDMHIHIDKINKKRIQYITNCITNSRKIMLITDNSLNQKVLIYLTQYKKHIKSFLILLKKKLVF